MSQKPSTSGVERRTNGPKASLSRRRLIAATTAVGSTVLAGCSAAVDYLAGFILDDVNLFNATDRTLSGEIRVTDPDGATVLSEQFEVEPEEDDDDDANSDSGAVFEDVIGDSGEYHITVDLNEGNTIDGETDTERTVSVTDPEEEHIVVVLGAAETDVPVDAFVIEEFTEMQDHLSGE